MKIGIFDSGIGGLTVLKKLIEKKPKNDYIYFGDTKNLPYGEKTKQELKIYTENIIHFLLKENVECIIIACGTVSANVYPELKETSVPIYDILTPTLQKLDNYHKIGVLGTNMTVKSNFFQNQLKKKNKIGIVKACPNLVPLIETNQMESEMLTKELCHYLKPLQKENVEVIILGCTHYPLIKDKIEKLTDKKTIDLADALAEKIPEGNTSSITLYFSKIDETLKENVKNILKKEIPLHLEKGE